MIIIIGDSAEARDILPNPLVPQLFQWSYFVLNLTHFRVAFITDKCCQSHVGEIALLLKIAKFNIQNSALIGMLFSALTGR